MLWLPREFLLISWMTRLYVDELVVKGVSLSREGELAIQGFYADELAVHADELTDRGIYAEELVARRVYTDELADQG